MKTQHLSDADHPAGLTVPEAARVLRIGTEKLRRMIRKGDIGAVDVGCPTRPRLILLPAHLEAFMASHSAAEQPRRRKAKKPGKRPDTGRKDYFPGT
jgi:excisionase family DNA binding protein